MVTLHSRLDEVLSDKGAALLADEFGLHTVEDLLRRYPHRYAAQGQPLTENDPPEGGHITVIGKIVSTKLNDYGKGRPLRVVLDAGGSMVNATFFNGHKVQFNMKLGRRVMLSGNVKHWPPGSASWGLNHPDYVLLPDGDDDELVTPTKGGGGLGELMKGAKKFGIELDTSIFDWPFLPIYPASADVQTWHLLACVGSILDRLEPIPDPLPLDIRADRGLMDLDKALRLIHRPDSKEDIDAARDRLRFDEAAALALVMASRRHEVEGRSARPCPARQTGIAATFDQQLPFELTAGQQAVAKDISTDLTRPHPMHRLLQGEVGSGKTIVALRAMLQVVDAGMQCALLAPTEVLAAQHYRSLTTMLGPLGAGGQLGAAEQSTRIVLLTGSMSVAAKRDALLAAVAGDAGIVIGTHALIQDNVEFFDLGLVVVDEQHRFGVEQRDALRAKAKKGSSPHLLAMTATPIPRTIAMTLLGDLETSTLTELPKGRAPITTKVVAAKQNPTWVERAWSRIEEEVAAGRQAYVVCSRIGDEPPEKTKGKKSELPPTQAVVELFEKLQAGPLRHVSIGLLHGRLPADEKDAVMREFTDGKIDVLVCTTVIEVGVDVPNATVMVIVDADRFGVSQLHQLRGRIGRGGHPGLCIMITDASPVGTAMARLDAVAGTTDGFELALLDLRQRREGDILGAAQSGTDTTLRLLSLLDDFDVISAAQDFARAIVAADPDLTAHPGLADLMHSALTQDRLEYLAKS